MTRLTGEVARVQLGGDGVHEVRQVVRGGLDDRAGRLVAVLVARGREGAHRGGLATAPRDEVEDAAQLGVDRIGVRLALRAVQIRARQGAHRGGLFAGCTLADQGTDAVGQ